MQFSAGQGKKITALEALSIDGLEAWAPRGINISISIQFHDPCTIGSSRLGELKYAISPG